MMFVAARWRRMQGAATQAMPEPSSRSCDAADAAIPPPPAGQAVLRAISALLVVADGSGIDSSLRLDLARKTACKHHRIYGTEH
jgi:hypothetical protein